MFLDVPNSSYCEIALWNGNGVDSVYGTRGGTEPSMERRVGGTGGSVERHFTFNLGVSTWGLTGYVGVDILRGRASGSESGNMKTEIERYAKWSVVYLYESSTSLHRLCM